MTSTPSAPPDNQAPRPLLAVTAEVPRECAEAVAAFLAEEEVAASVWEDWDGGPSRIEFFLEAGTDPADAQAALRRAGVACGLQLEPAVEMRPPETWTETWKRFFHTVRISPRLVVRPPWETYTPAADEQVLVMDPGLSFGTGLHATTQACMQMLDELAQGDLSRRVLDIGCGSGILSIAAARLGFTDVAGYDNDPIAVRTAREHAAVNKADVTYTLGDLAAVPAQGDIVVAYVLAVVLAAEAAAVAAAVRDGPGHALLLSGILDSQYADVAASYAAQGFREVKSVLIGEWRSGWFDRLAAGEPAAATAGRRQ